MNQPKTLFIIGFEAIFDMAPAPKKFARFLPILILTDFNKFIASTPRPSFMANLFFWGPSKFRSINKNAEYIS